MPATKKLFVPIAAALRTALIAAGESSEARQIVVDLARTIAVEFKLDNPNFNTPVFLTAAGLGSVG